MNYFEFYDLPISFNPDQQKIKQKFYELSKKYHPDFYINQDQQKQDEVLELSTLNNKAYQILSNPNKLLPYILTLKGELIEGENYTLPQSFLMEMMDVNEAIIELEFDPNPDKLKELKTQVNTIEQEIIQQLNQQTHTFDQNSENPASQLKNIKDLYYRNKYIDRIKDNINKLTS